MYAEISDIIIVEMRMGKWKKKIIFNSPKIPEGLC
jgi:hypothetical protein